MKTLRFLIVFAFLLVGCASPTPAPATSTAATIEPTATALPTTTEPAPLPTETIIPTVQPTPIAATSTPNAQEQEYAAILPLVAPCAFADNQPISYSPDKTWVVVACRGDRVEDGIIQKFARMDGKQQWAISFKDVFVEPYRSADPDQSALLQKTFIPARWTVNEDFVYLAAPTTNDNIAYKGYYGLFRLNLSTGESSPTLLPVYAPQAITYAFKFSPRGGKLAYIAQGATPLLTIVIEESATGEETEIKLDSKFTQGGNLLWTEDEQHLVFSVFDKSTNGGNSMILYNLENNKTKYVIQQSSEIYLPLSWKSNVLVYAEKYPGSWVYINISTKEITAAPAPTPVP